MLTSTVKPFKRATGAIFPYLPHFIRSRIFPPHLNWDTGDLRAIPQAGNTEIRLLIAPANYAAQAHLWAQAAQRLPGVSAATLQYKKASALRFPADVSISKAMSAQSKRWSRDASKYILANFTHILVEAEQPFLGAVYNRDIYREIDAMLGAGIKVAFASHGSDLRTPSLHRTLHKDSPFNSDLDGLTSNLQKTTDFNHQLIKHFNLPVFVPTPDILAYVPTAIWLPLTADIKEWASLPVHPWSDKPRFLHVPSRAALKGTAAIRSALIPLAEAGKIEYRELSSLTPNQMRQEIAAADVVVDQLTMGLYSTTAVEALAAKKLVIAEVSESNRRRIEDLSGWECPIIEANSETLNSVALNIASFPQDFMSRISLGTQYVDQVHGPANIAQALNGFLGAVTGAEEEG